MAAGYLLLKRCCTMIGIALIAIGFGQPLYAQSAGACPCFNEHQLKGLFTPIVKTGGTVRCQEYPGEVGTFVSIYGYSEKDRSGQTMEIMAAAQNILHEPEPPFNFCYITPLPKGDSIERFLRFHYNLTEAETVACMEIIENTVQVFGEVCVVSD